MTIENFVPTLRRLAGDFWNGSRIRWLFYSTTTKVSLKCKITRQKVNEPRADATRRRPSRILILKKFPQSSRNSTRGSFSTPVDKLPWKSFCTTAKTGFPHDGLASGTASVTLTYNSLHSVIFLRGFQRATLGEFSILITYVNRTYDLVKSGWEKWSLGFSIDMYKMLFAMYRKDFYVAENNTNN